MFESKQGQIPGYTGHQRTFEQTDEYRQKTVPQKQIPGKAPINSVQATRATFRASSQRWSSGKPTG